MADLVNEVQELIKGLTPAAAKVVGAMIVAEGFDYLIPDDIAKRYMEFQADKAEEVKRSILRTYISKRAAGEDVSHVVELATAIGKADDFGFTSQERSANAKKQRRGPGGRFTTMNHKIRYSRAPEPMDAEDEDNLGIVYPTTKNGASRRDAMTPEDRARYQEAYTQITSALRNQRNARGVGQLVVNYDDGVERAQAIPDENNPLTLRTDKKVLSARVEITPPDYGDRVQGPGATFNVVNAMTNSPDFAAHVAGGKYGRYGQARDWSRRQGEEFVPGQANFRRLEQGSNFLQDAVGPFLPSSAQAALSVGSFVGQYGPQAQQVFGPAMDRAKYRYTGTERKLDPALGEAIKSTRARTRTSNATPAQNSNAYRDQMVHGMKVMGRNGRTIAREPSPVMDYMRSLLPSKTLSALQRFSGHQPPSQGILLNDKGRVTHQMIGSGEDWYLPFDLNNLGELQGGEYIRTRGNGGLTTEDIYTGLMAGARSMSVVSRDGVHTLEFDDTLRGSRRYSSTAREMTDRYGKLLDAVKNGEVYVNDIDPSRKAELSVQAAGDRDVYRALVNNDRKNPQVSSEMATTWLNDFMDEEAAKVETSDGREVTRAELTSQIINREATRRADADNAYVDGVLGQFPEDKMDEIFTELESNPRTIIAMMDPNRRERWNSYAEKREDDYRDNLKPLTLNGDGYDYAMQALKEQYPYFIRDTSYTKWDQERDNGQDRGYVKPNFVRPEASKAGYFDDSVNGYGKISSDRIRYQNSGVMRRLGRSHEFSEGRRPDSERSTQDEVSTPKGAPPSTPSTPEAPAKPSPTKRDATMELGKHLLSRKAFSTRMNVPEFGDDWNRNSRGQDVDVHRKNGWMNSDAEFKPFTMTPEELGKLSPEELDETVGKMLSVAKKYNLFDDVDQNIVASYERGGAPAPKEKWTNESAFDDLTGDVDMDFGADFEPGRAKALYELTYGQDPDIMQLARAYTTNNASVPKLGSVGFNDRVDEVMEQVQEYLQQVPDDKDATAVIKGAAKAKQLNRVFVNAPDTKLTDRSYLQPPTKGSTPTPTFQQPPWAAGRSGATMGMFNPISPSRN